MQHLVAILLGFQHRRRRFAVKMPEVALMALISASSAACNGDTQGPTQPDCKAANLAMKHSAIVVRGRTIPLRASASKADDAGSVAKVSWRSSNEDVASVIGDTALEAKSSGITLLTATACDLKDTTSVLVLGTGYSVTTLTVGVPISLSDSGHVVGYGPGSARQWIWRAGVVTEMAGCLPRDVNDFGVVLCIARGPTTWHAGARAQRDTFSLMISVAINDSGHVLLAPTSTGNALRWLAPGTTEHAGGFLFGQALAMNNAGDVIGLGGDTGYPDGTLYTRGGVGHTLTGFGRWSNARSLNEATDVVGNAEYMGPCGITACQRPVAVWWPAATRSATLLRTYVGSGPPSDMATMAVAINDAKHIVANGSAGGMVYADGRLGVLSHMVADPELEVTETHDINNRGVILATVKNRTTGAMAVVLLSPP